MDSPLQLLRDLLPFAAPAADQRDMATLRELRDTITGLSPQESIAKLASSILPAASQQPNLHMRFKLLEDIRQEAEQALPVLESHISQAVLPLPLDAATAALHADNLLKGMAIAYAGIARSIAKAQLNGPMTHLFHRGIQRAMAMIARRQLLAYRAYADPSATSWLTLHELYRLVRGPQPKPLNGETAPIEQEYLGALLFAFLEPAKFPRAELEMVHRCAQQLAAYATVREADADTGTTRPLEPGFLIRPDEGSPGYPLTRLPFGLSVFGSLVLDCSAVLAALDRNITRRPGKKVEPDLDAPPATLQCLRVAIGGKSARRFSRTRFRPRGDLISGLPQVINFLDGNAFSRRSVDSASRYGNRDFMTSEWSLVDESPDGFLLRFIKGEKKRIGAGDIIALQPRESSKIHVCLVRRISTSQVRLEVGVQLLSPQISVVDVIADDTPEQLAIFLHSLPAYGKFSGLIANPGNYRTGQAITIKLPGHSLHKRIGTCMEANVGLEFFALDPLSD